MKKNRSYVSLFAVVGFALFFVACLCLFVSKRSLAFADFLNETVCHVFRMVMAKLGGIIPFSIYELLMLSIPLLVIIVVILAIRRYKSGKGRIKFVLNLLAIALLMYAGHVFSLGIAYNATPVNEKMGIETVEVTEKRLADIMIQLRDEINLLTEEINYSD